MRDAPHHEVVDKEAGHLTEIGEPGKAAGDVAGVDDLVVVGDVDWALLEDEVSQLGAAAEQEDQRHGPALASPNQAQLPQAAEVLHHFNDLTMIFFCIVESLIQNSILLSLVRTLSNVRFRHDYRHHLHQSSEVRQGQRVAVDGVRRGEGDVQAEQARGEVCPAVARQHITEPPG